MTDDTSTENQDDYGYAPIRVESFWGAVALVCLCQIYYFILFEGFIFVSGTHVKLLYVWFGILFVISVTAQAEVMVKIESFFSKKRPQPADFSPDTLEEKIKLFLAVAFGLIFVLFCLGHYPFPSTPYKWWHAVMFYIFTWFLSFCAAYNLRKGIDTKQPQGMMNVIPVIMGMTFFTAAAVLGRVYNEVFYLIGTFGMGFAMIPARALFLANNTGKPK